MRIIEIDARTDDVVISDFNAGVQGEHRNSELHIMLPASMISGADFWTVDFDCDGAVFSTGNITDTLSADGNSVFDDGVVKVKLWQQLTQCTRMTATVSAFKVVGNTASLIASTPLISALYFSPSVSFDETPAAGGIEIELANKVDKEPGKGLSSNDFTDADKSKLAAVDVKYSVQHYADLSSLPQTAGTRATVQSDGNQLAFGTFDLEINNDLAAPAIFPIPNMSNIGGIYDYPSGGSGRSVTVGFTVDATDGTPLILVYVSVNGVTYLGISRDATIGTTALTKGWYIASDGTPAEKPTLDDFEIVRFSLGGTTYTSGDTLPTDRIKLLSRFINISQNDMQGAGEYVCNGSAWEYSPKEDELLYFFGELLPNKKYFCHIGQDLSLTLPAASAIDASRDNSILLYLECTSDVDLSLPSSVRFYGGILPDTSTGSHELTFIYNPNTGAWTVGGLDSEAVT